MDTDEDLQELASADEEVQAVGDLYRRHHPAVLRVTQALLRQGADAQDAAQEAFLKAMQSTHGFRRDGPVRRWLLKIATNVAIDQKRSRSRGANAAAVEGGAPADPAIAAETAEWERLLLRSLLDLAPEFREVLVLRYWDDCSVSDISRRLGIPRSTAHQRCRQGLGLLRERLGPRGLKTLPLFLGTLPRVITVLESSSVSSVIAGGATLMASKGYVVAAALVIVCLPLLFMDWSTTDPSDAPSTNQTKVEGDLTGGDGERGDGAPNGQAHSPVVSKRFASDEPRTKATGGWRLRGRLLVAGAPAPIGSVVKVRLHAGWWDGRWEETDDVLTEATVEVDEDGRFEWASESPGVSVTVVAHASREGFLDRTESHLVVSDASPPQDLKLDLLPLDAWVSGVVRDGEGNLVPHPKVSCFREQVTGDKEGRYRIRSTSHFKNQRLTAWVEGFAVTRETVDAPAPGGTAELDLVIERGLVIAGRVTDGTGQPVANARITSWEARPRHQTTGANGSYRLLGFARGRRASFKVNAPGYVDHRESLSEVVKELLDHDIALFRGSAVRGLVANEEGLPVEGARIGVGHGFNMSSTLKSVTDHEGRFEIPDVKAGLIEVHVRRNGYAQLKTSTVVPKAGEPVDELRMTLVKGETLLGRLVDEAGKPVGGARVAAKKDREYLETSATSASDGTFDLVDVSGPEVDIEVYGRGLVRLNTTVTLEPTRVDLVVKRHGVVAGRVIDDATGAPLDRFRLRIVRAIVQKGDVHIDGYSSELADRGRWFARRSGEFVIDDEECPVGVVLGLEAWAEGYAPATAPRVFTTAKPETDALVFRLQRAAALVGRVLDAAEGGPVAGARVRWELADALPTRSPDFDTDDARTVATDADGGFRFDDLPPRQVRIEIDATGYPFFREGPIATQGPGSTTKRTFYLSRGAVLTGLVEDGPGIPSPGARISLRSQDRKDGVRRYHNTKADEAGRFRIEGLAPGRWRASCQCLVGRYGIGLFGKSVVITEAKTYDIILKREGDASLVVTIRSDQPLPANLTVNAIPTGPAEPRPQAQVAIVENGRATFSAIGAGQWRLVAAVLGDWQGRAPHGTADAELKRGEKGTVEIELKK